MKKLFLIGISIAAMLSTNSELMAQSKQQRQKEMAKTVIQKIESKSYKIEINTALPIRGRSISVSPHYSLKIDQDSVFSYLPYFGRAYHIPYGGGDGLNFQTRLKTYTMNIDKKGTARIEFTAQTPEDTFDFTLDIFNNGSANVRVSMQNRESIHFIGNLVTETTP